MIKKIKFIPSQAAVDFKIDPPQPATRFVADWYRHGEMYVSKETLELPSPGEEKSGGMKSCMPFLDVMISGYMFVTWHDIEITKNENNEVEWKYVEQYAPGKWEDMINNDILPLIDERKGALGETIPRPVGHAHNHFVWKNQWGTRVPRGWSVLVTHPYNRYDLPFTTLNAFMDSDQFWANGNIPFFIKDGWTGIIKKGTPFAQLIPINRKSWISEVSYSSYPYSEYIAHQSRSVPYHYYRDFLWKKKDYK